MGFEVGKTVAGYEVVEVLNGSKAGLAYKVRNVFAQRFEILKILPKGMQDDEEQIARFLREIKVHARLVHPNIVSFYNAREIDGQLVMTTEFVPGLTIEERVASGPIEWHDAIKFACQALSALEYAHANGVIHRGLTASSLVVTPEGIVRLSGFGLAKPVNDPQLTAVGTVIGALRYISPEQVKGLPVDARCDLYSLGVVLYEMLTGKLPFDSKGQFEMMLAHVNTLPKHSSEMNPAVPPAAGDVAMKALAKDPNQRFQNAPEFRAALERLGSSESAPLAPAPAGTVVASAGSPAVSPANGIHDTAPAVAVAEPPRTEPAVASVPALKVPVPVPRFDAPPASGSPDVAAVFKDFFFSKVGISLAACAVTFILGSVALLALLAITKP